MALLLFAATLFVSAFLLFLVQPMIGKMILPRLGGTPQVWNTCMVFFQTALLAGYAYTHTVSTRLKLRTQLLTHGALLFGPLLLIGFFLFGPWGLGGPDQSVNAGTFRGITKDWIPPPGINPIPATLVLLTIVVGLPFFVVSTSAPLLQKWFVHTGHPAAHDPYFLYGASNLGSMLSLLLYPVLIEPFLGLYAQSWTWIVGYGLLVVLYFVCVALVWKAPPTVHLPGAEEKPKEAEAEVPKPVVKEEKKEPKVTGITAKPKGQQPLSTRIRKGSKQRPHRPLPQPVVQQKAATPAAPRLAYQETRSDVMTPWRRLRWVALAFVPSSLMLGITTYISTDVSAIAMFWIVPLALYLLSFILVFSRWPTIWTRVPHTLMCLAQPLWLAGFLFLLLTHQVTPIFRSLFVSIGAFFFTAMVSHGELARDRPSPKHLTEFYLLMSVGGMLGGVFNALLAPVLFQWGLYELYFALAAACMVRPFVSRLFPLDRPILVVWCAANGLILGAIVGLPINLMLGVLIGVGAGILIGSALTFEVRPNGWIDSWLISVFPDLGEWARKKGEEMRQQAGTPAPAAEAEVKPHHRSVRHEVPDYYVLNYGLDFILPVLVLLYMVLYIGYLQGHASSWGYYIAAKTFSFKPDAARQLAQLFALALQYGVPLFCVFLFSSRPLRMGVALALIFLVSMYVETSSSRREGTMVLARSRTYFGILQVIAQLPTPGYAENPPLTQSEADTINEAAQPSLPLLKGGEGTPYTYLMHGTTHHGLNYQSPRGLRRLATTYYHRKGPVGVIFERFNWFPGPQNTYWGDYRMPASLVGFSAVGLNFGTIPDNLLVDLWSEPPYCCVGLGTGTMASYCRPFQHMTFYEIDNQIRSFSLEKFNLPAELFVGDSKSNPQARQGPYFNYVHDALVRGGNVEIYMGDARISMEAATEKLRETNRDKGDYDNWEETREGITYQYREGYYHAMEIDAFSSDAIPVHLITEEAIKQYFDKSVPEGVVMVHTSNRHLELVKPVIDIAVALNLDYRKVNCYGQEGPFRNGEGGSALRGHFQSEYVMLSRKVPESSNPNPPELVASTIGMLGAPVAEGPLLAAAGLVPGRVPDPRKEYLDRIKARLDQLLASRETWTGMKTEMRKVWERGDSYLPVATPDEGPGVSGYQFWTVPPPARSRIWTDDYSNMIGVLRWGFGFTK